MILILITSLYYSCQESSKKDTNTTENALFTKISSSDSKIDFKNTVSNSKELNIFRYRNFYNGGGVGIGDINNDGLPDIYFTANMGKNKLYLNKGNFVFEDITEKAKVGGANTWSTGVVMVDINNDNLLDIYVCNAGNIEGDDLKNELYINNGDLTFSEEAEKYNLAESGLTTHTAFFDYDKDGDLDAYILNNSFIPVSSLNYSNKRELRDKDWDVPNLLKGGGDKLLRNDNGKFTDVSAEANIYGSLIGFGLGVTVGDINQDTYPDIYVSNDFYERDYLYINNQDGTFTESIKEWANHISMSSMGADMADINNDGQLDVFVTDMLPEADKRLKETTLFENYNVYQRKQGLDFYHQYMQNTLQLNMGNDTFSEIASFAGVSKTDWSWGALLFDMDNDGYKDIFVCNGIYHDLTNQDFMNYFANDIIQEMVVTGEREEVNKVIDKMPSTPIPNYAFKNNADLSFTNATANWGLDTPSFSNGAAYVDLDNDGDLDIVINNVNQEASLYKNNSETLSDNNFIKIQLKGNTPNTFGIGSTIRLYSGEQIIIQEVIPSRGFQSSTDYVQTIGIGTKQIDSIHVQWTDNTLESITNVSPNTTYTLEQKNASKSVAKTSKTSKSYLTELATTLEAHKENNHVDFNYEGLIQQMLSKEGPTLSIGDVNGDQTEDIFIGNAKGQAAQLYLQKAAGTLTTTQNTSFTADKAFEDTASTFSDIDGDNDLDLIVGSGGNDINEEKKNTLRIYLNDGKGNFTKTSTQLPRINHNISVITAADFDNDGDEDLFVGSRSVPAIYGVDAKHLLLENDGKGTFKDITASKAYKFKNLGMVTDAQWQHMDGDDNLDLVITTDWGTPYIFKNNGRRLSLLETNLNEANGWWNTLKIVDVNKDGKQDIILGNKGLNLLYKPSKERPMKLYINDFDNNGTIEQIVTQTINGKDVPVVTKHELTAQIVSLKKQNTKFAEYASKSIDELFSKEVLANAIVKMVTEPQHLIAINKGNGQFEIKELPRETQLSSVNAIEVFDVNNDGNLDLILGGNQYQYKPQYARLDANYGSILLGNGMEEFTWQAYEKTGFFVKGEVKAIQKLATKAGIHLIIGINNEKPKVFKRSNE
ncbi:MAG: VCBS repeat-containing protein [Bacteroidota bacterium]